MSRRKRQSTLIAALAGAAWFGVFVAGCSSPRAPARDEWCRERSCAESATLAVLSGVDATTSKPICGGVVVAQTESETLVLTAAHCGLARADKGKQLFVRASCAAARVSPVEVIERHPLFRAGDPKSADDFAVLRVPRLACARPVPRAEARAYAGSDVQVPDGGAWRSLRVASVTALRLQLERQDGALCQGSSGLPLLLEGARGLELVGLVSGGRGDCRGALQAGRVDALSADLSKDWRFSEGHGLASRRTCAQCAEQLSSGSGPCGNTESQCARDDSCTRAVACLASCRSVDCERACLAEPRSAPLATLLRCACAAGCSAPCATHCAL